MRSPSGDGCRATASAYVMVWSRNESNVGTDCEPLILLSPLLRQSSGLQCRDTAEHYADANACFRSNNCFSALITDGSLPHSSPIEIRGRVLYRCFDTRRAINTEQKATSTATAPQLIGLPEESHP